MTKRLSKPWRILIVTALTLAVLTGACCGAVALFCYADADAAALACLQDVPGVTVQKTDFGWAFVPDEPRCGLIFYPGGFVPAEAYAPLLRDLAAQGVLCLTPDMPLRLAVMNLHAADALPAQYPQVERWAIGGHSLGGTMAANCAAAHPGRYSALLLLASYTNVDVSGSGMDVLSIYGDQDTVLNAANYAACRSHLPEGFTEVILPGGNHAQFGSYGMQKGDSPALITPQQQLASTVACCLEVLTGNP